MTTQADTREAVQAAVEWLTAKHKRHREIEDKQAADLIESQSAALTELRAECERLNAECQQHLTQALKNGQAAQAAEAAPVVGGEALSSAPTRARPYSQPGEEHVEKHGEGQCPTCGVACRTEYVLWYNQHLGTQSRTDFIPTAPLTDVQGGGDPGYYDDGSDRVRDWRTPQAASEGEDMVQRSLRERAEAVKAAATEDMCDSVRYLLVGMGQPGQTFGGIRQHCEWSGMDTSHWPDWTRGRDSEHFNKSARAALIWHCMYHAATVVRLVPDCGEG